MREHGKGQRLIVNLVRSAGAWIILLVKPFVDSYLRLTRLPNEVFAVFFRNVNVKLLHWNMLIAWRTSIHGVWCHCEGRPHGKFPAARHELQNLAPAHSIWLIICLRLVAYLAATWLG